MEDIDGKHEVGVDAQPVAGLDAARLVAAACVWGVGSSGVGTAASSSRDPGSTATIAGGAAHSAGDIVLVSEELATVVRAIDIARTTHGRIRQNLFWAFFYNLALIPIAALGWLIPAMAAGASCSDTRREE